LAKTTPISQAWWLLEGAQQKLLQKQRLCMLLWLLHEQQPRMPCALAEQLVMLHRSSMVVT